MQIKVFYIRHVQSMPDLFGNVVPVDGNNVLKSIIINDFMKRKELSFINPRNGKTYHRHYAIMPQGGVTVINVGKYVDGNFVYATVGINLSRNLYEPYVVIGCHHSEFSNMKLIVNMVTQSLNWALTDNCTAVKLEACRKPIDWEMDFVHSYLSGITNREFTLMNIFGFEQLEEMFMSMGKKKTRPKNSHDIGSYLIEGTEAPILAWLHKMIDNKTQPKDMMRPVRAVIELKRTFKISYDAFIIEFGKQGMISRTTYNDYVNQAKTPYYDDEKYKRIMKKVEKTFTFCIKEE